MMLVEALRRPKTDTFKELEQKPKVVTTRMTVKEANKKLRSLGQTPLMVGNRLLDIVRGQ